MNFLQKVGIICQALKPLESERRVHHFLHERSLLLIVLRQSSCRNTKELLMLRISRLVIKSVLEVRPKFFVVSG